MSIKCLMMHSSAELQSVINSAVLITGDKMLHNEETAINMWCLSIDPSSIKNFLIKDFIAFVSSLLKKRTEQIIDLGIVHPAVFYMWFDEMACQLRFNIVSDFNQNLPFRCQLKIVSSPQSVLEDFLTSHYHAGIPWDELKESANSEDDIDQDEVPFVLKVFVTHLSAAK